MLGDINIAEPGALVVLLDLGLRHNRIYLKVFKHQILLEHDFFGLHYRKELKEQNKQHIDLIKITLVR
jgi:hypothetical protein